MNNFESIKAMNIDELALWLSSQECENCCIHAINGACYNEDKNCCVDGIKKWLKKEVKNDTAKTVR